jgi:hypothetical protein
MGAQLWRLLEIGVERDGPESDGKLLDEHAHGG